MPPNDVARFHKLTEAAAMAACSPFLMRTENMPPKPPRAVSRGAVAWPGWLGKSGIKHLRDLVIPTRRLARSAAVLAWLRTRIIEGAHAPH